MLRVCSEGRTRSLGINDGAGGEQREQSAGEQSNRRQDAGAAERHCGAGEQHDQPADEELAAAVDVAGAAGEPTHGDATTDGEGDRRVVHAAPIRKPRQPGDDESPDRDQSDVTKRVARTIRRLHKNSILPDWRSEAGFDDENGLAIAKTFTEVGAFPPVLRHTQVQGVGDAFVWHGKEPQIGPAGAERTTGRLVSVQKSSELRVGRIELAAFEQKLSVEEGLDLHSSLPSKAKPGLNCND